MGNELFRWFAAEVVAALDHHSSIKDGPCRVDTCRNRLCRLCIQCTIKSDWTSSKIWFFFFNSLRKWMVKRKRRFVYYWSCTDEKPRRRFGHQQRSILHVLGVDSLVHLLARLAKNNKKFRSIFNSSLRLFNWIKSVVWSRWTEIRKTMVKPFGAHRNYSIQNLEMRGRWPSIV